MSEGLLYSRWSKTRIFAAWWYNRYFFFLKMQPLFPEWKRQIVVFLRIASKEHQSGFNKIYTQYWMDMTKQPTEFHFFPNKCFKRKWRFKFQVSKYRLRWNAEDMTSSIISPQKELDNCRFYMHFTTGNRLVCYREMTFSTSFTCPHTIILETIII